MTDAISDKSLKEAIHRIAHTPDGTALYLYLQRKLMTVEPDLGALPRHEGARMLALELTNLMAKGITESGRRAGGDGNGDGQREQPLVFARPEPVDVRKPSGAGRRINEHTRVPGWDDTGPDADK